MIFKSKQVNTDQKPYRNEDSTERLTAQEAEQDRETGWEVTHDPRPEFNVTRDKRPWDVSRSRPSSLGQIREWRRFASRAEGEGWGQIVEFDPRPEFDHPVNRILVAFRQGRFASLDWFLHEYCHDTDSWVWDGTNAENPTPDEIDHARRVLTRLAEWQRPATGTSSAIETREDT